MPVSGIAAHTDGLRDQAEERQAEAWDGSPAAEGAAALASQPEPEILGAPGGLSLADFFAPRMWLLTLAPVAVTMFVAQLSAVRFADRLLLWGGAVYEDSFFQPAGIGWYAAHLLPFGVPMSLDVGFGQQYMTIMLQTSPIAGALALLAGFLLVIAYTKDSNDGVFACGPYAVYSLLAVLLTWRTGPFYDIDLRSGDLSALFQVLLGCLLAPILAATLAKIVAVGMRNAGMFDIDEEARSFDDEPLLASTRATVAPSPAAPLRKGRRRKGAAEASLFVEPDRPTPDAVEAAPDRTPVGRAVVCPWCGSHRANPDKPGPCPSCHKNVALAFEWSNGKQCFSCHGILLRDSAFCHHCGKWQQAADVDGAEEEAG